MTKSKQGRPPRKAALARRSCKIGWSVCTFFVVCVHNVNKNEICLKNDCLFLHEMI